MNFHCGNNYNERFGCSSGEIINRSYKIFRIDPHSKKKLIVIRGEITIQITNSEANELLGEETRDLKKIIRLEGLKESTNAERVAEEIFDKCPFLDKSLTEYLVSIIEVVKNRVYDEYGLAIPCEEEEDDEFTDCFEDTGTDMDDSDNQGAEMSNVEYYIELLYEELSDKVKGARFIARLAKMPENLVAIANHETALNALFRTLREDYKKSLDLTTNILHVCFYYSHFDDFHDMLISNKICSITFDILEYEMTRNEKWKEEVVHRKELAEAQDASAKTKHNFEKMMGRYSEVVRKQDDLLRVAFDVIFRLYEHPQLHDEILKRGIVGYLMEALDRKNIDLLLLVVDFLKTLSIFAECKSAMNQLQIIDKIFLLVDSNFPNDLISLCLRLLYNLSFDTKMRHRMVKLGLLPKLGHFFGDPELEPVCLNIFYIMSMDRRIRPKIAPTNVVPVTMRILMKSEEEEPLNIEARSLSINLAHNKRCCVSMCANNGVANLLSKAFETEDPLMMKIIRNLAQHEGATKELFIEYISDLAAAITKVAARDFALECVGTLAHLTIPELDYAKLLQEFGLIPWIKSILQNPKNNSHSAATKKEGKISLLDVVCAVVVFLGTCAADADCAEYLIQQGILDLLLKAYNNRGDRPIDMDIRLHILYFFYRLSGHRKTRAYLVENTRIPNLLLDLLHSHEANESVREIVEAALDLIGGYNESWESQVKKERFLIYNEPWIEMIEKISKDPLLQADMELASSLGLSTADDPLSVNINGNGLGGKRRGDKSKMTLEVPSSASTTDDTHLSGSEESDTEVDEDSDNGHQGQGDTRSHRQRRHPRPHPDDDEEEDDDEDEDDSDEDGEDDREEDENEEEEEGKPKSIFDRFKHQFDYEMDRKERWEYGISDDDDDEGDQNDIDNDDMGIPLPLPHPESVSYRVASAFAAKRSMELAQQENRNNSSNTIRSSRKFNSGPGQLPSGLLNSNNNTSNPPTIMRPRTSSSSISSKSLDRRLQTALISRNKLTSSSSSASSSATMGIGINKMNGGGEDKNKDGKEAITNNDQGAP